MTAAQAPAGGERQPVAWLQPYLLVLALWAACLGVVVIARMVQDAGSHARASHTSATASSVAGEALAGPSSPDELRLTKTDFGSIGVTAPTFVHGTTARALGGQAHGIQGYVPPSRQLVQVPITLHNDLSRSVRYEPKWFRLIGAQSMAPVTSNLRAGTLRPGATIDGTIAFNAPRDGHRLWLEFGEPRHGKLRIDLGGTGSSYRPKPGDTSAHTAHR